jgi:serine/threonine protein kinase
MITGQVPFRADSVSEVVSHIVSGALDMGQVPSGNRWQPLRRVVMSALARDPKERSGDASTMANELAAALIELGDDAEWTQKRVPGGVTRN